MITTVLVDMGNVLVHFSHERMCRQIAELCGLDPADVRRSLFDSGLQHAFESGRLSERALHARLEEIAGRPIDFDALLHAGSDIFERHAAIEPIVRGLKARGYRLVLLSNTSISHFRHVRRHFDVLSEFDAYVLSYEVGALKPQPAIFEAALSAARCAPEQCFYTDDIADYISAARQHRIDAEVFTTAGALIEHLAARGVDVRA